jgi:hypothetical protein
MDGGFENEQINLRREFLTIDNIVELFRKYKVPQEFDLLSIDLDMFDFWILEKILKVYMPRIIVAEVNPTLGHNVHQQSHEHFMQSFRDLNALPLTANHPHTMEQEGWDGTRYSGANPLAFQLLTKEFGYEMVYCESCGVNCFFVLKALMPESCPAAYPTPSIHYPCYGTGPAGMLGHKSDPLRRDPVLLSPGLVRQIVHGDIDDLVAEKFASHLLHLDRSRRVSIDRNEMPQCDDDDDDVCDTGFNLEGDANLSCDCLQQGKSCVSPDKMISSELKVFQSYFDIYNVVTQPRLTDPTITTNKASYAWTCYLLHKLKNSTVCEHLAALYYQKSLHLLQTDQFGDARDTAVLGLRFDIRNRNLLHLLNYFNLNTFIMESDAEVYSLEYVEVLLGDEVQVIGIGAGMCDNIHHTIQHHALLSNYYLAIYEKIALKTLKQFFGGYLTADNSYTHVPKSISPDALSLGTEGPYHETSDFFTSTFIHACFSRTLFKYANEKINQVCEKRSSFETMLIFSPPFSGSERIKQILTEAAANSLLQLQVDSDLLQLNDHILGSLGCQEAAHRWSAACKRGLQTLSRGFLPAITSSTHHDFWNNITQSIYQKRLRHGTPLLLLSDPIFSFTLPLWEEPLGATRVVIPLTSPVFAVECWARTENISKDNALSLFVLYFSSMVEAVKGHEDVLFLNYSPETIQTEVNLFNSGNEFFLDNITKMNILTDSCGSPPTLPVDVDDSALQIVPVWLQECVNAMVQDNSAGACVLLPV